MKRFVVVLLILCLLPLHALAGYYIVDCYAIHPDGDTVPVYTKASTRSAKVGDFYVHQPMSWDSEVEDDADGWVKLCEPDVGYIQAKYLDHSAQSYELHHGADRLPQLTVAADAPLLAGASTSEKPITTLPKGLNLLALGDCGDFYYVEVQCLSLAGFVCKEDVTPTGQVFSTYDPSPSAATVTLYHADGLGYTPIYTDFSRSNGWLYSIGYITVYQNLGEWAVTNQGLIETRFFDKDGDHSLPTAYTSTSDEASRLLMRQKPEKSDSYAAKYFSGVPVTILGESGGYTLVALGNTTGWFATEYLTDMQIDRRVQAVLPLGATIGYDENEVTIYPGDQVTLIGSKGKDMLCLVNGQRYYLPLEDLIPVEGSGVLDAKTTVRLKMHSTISEGTEDEITLIPKGKKVTVLLHGDEYSKIEYNGKIGYVMTNYLKF